MKQDPVGKVTHKKHKSQKDYIRKNSLYRRAHCLLQVARRSWSGNNKAKETICRIMEENPNMKITIPNDVEDTDILDKALKD